MANTSGQKQSEIIISVPFSVLEELDRQAGGKLMQESEPTGALSFSAAALGRSDRLVCGVMGAKHNSPREQLVVIRQN